MKKTSKHKSKFAAIALVLLMASVLLTLYTPVQAQVSIPPEVALLYPIQDSGGVGEHRGGSLRYYYVMVQLEIYLC